MIRKNMVRLAAVVLVLALVLSGCTGGGYKGRVDGVSFTLPALGDNVCLRTQLQLDALADVEANGGVLDYLAYHVQGIWENSQPEPVALTWTAEAADTIDSYTVTVSKQADLSQPVYVLETTEPAAEITNLERGTTYYWTVTVHCGEKAVTSRAASFTTDTAGPRSLDVDGLSNARDCGGWATSDGGTVKQGLLYRCGRLNTSNIDTVRIEITDDGIHTLRDELGVRTELDLRGDEESVYLTQSPLGDGVSYYRIPMEWSGNILQLNEPQIRQVFSLLADEANYPLIVHCNIGTDRTGLICFLVNALLGVSEEDLCLDYAFSNFASIGGSRSADTITYSYLPLINECSGDTLSERTYNYLLQIGVPAEQLDAVISILK